LKRRLPCLCKRQDSSDTLISNDIRKDRPHVYCRSYVHLSKGLRINKCSCQIKTLQFSTFLEYRAFSLSPVQLEHEIELLIYPVWQGKHAATPQRALVFRYWLKKNVFIRRAHELLVPFDGLLPVKVECQGTKTLTVVICEQIPLG
jgi:hypothetical protein